jgi:hypothetical protein
MFLKDCELNKKFADSVKKKDFKQQQVQKKNAFDCHSTRMYSNNRSDTRCSSTVLASRLRISIAAQSSTFLTACSRSCLEPFTIVVNSESNAS